ncbi:hypothetical protein [Amycolatopsis sp. NPDC004079]|uniref:hypothetical protein n=1 Tax=Amycolatopsis sp. NPDC004079 TaxID=3154549 RepID=UPI0033BA1A69
MSTRVRDQDAQRPGWQHQQTRRMIAAAERAVTLRAARDQAAALPVFAVWGSYSLLANGDLRRDLDPGGNERDSVR